MLPNLTPPPTSTRPTLTRLHPVQCPHGARHARPPTHTHTARPLMFTPNESWHSKDPSTTSFSDRGGAWRHPGSRPSSFGGLPPPSPPGSAVLVHEGRSCTSRRPTSALDQVEDCLWAAVADGSCPTPVVQWSDATLPTRRGDAAAAPTTRATAMRTQTGTLMPTRPPAMLTQGGQAIAGMARTATRAIAPPSAFECSFAVPPTPSGAPDPCRVQDVRLRRNQFGYGYNKPMFQGPAHERARRRGTTGRSTCGVGGADPDEPDVGCEKVVSSDGFEQWTEDTSALDFVLDDVGNPAGSILRAAVLAATSMASVAICTALIAPSPPLPSPPPPRQPSAPPRSPPPAVPPPPQPFSPATSAPPRSPPPAVPPSPPPFPPAPRRLLGRHRRAAVAAAAAGLLAASICVISPSSLRRRQASTRRASRAGWRHGSLVTSELSLDVAPRVNATSNGTLAVTATAPATAAATAAEISDAAELSSLSAAGRRGAQVIYIIIYVPAPSVPPRPCRRPLRRPAPPRGDR